MAALVGVEGQDDQVHLLPQQVPAVRLDRVDAAQEVGAEDHQAHAARLQQVEHGVQAVPAARRWLSCVRSLAVDLRTMPEAVQRLDDECIASAQSPEDECAVQATQCGHDVGAVRTNADARARIAAVLVEPPLHRRPAEESDSVAHVRYLIPQVLAATQLGADTYVGKDARRSGQRLGECRCERCAR